MTDLPHISAGRLPNPFNLVEEHARRATPTVAIEIPLYAYPIAEASRKAMDEAPRHDITVGFTAEAPGMCLVCQGPTTAVTLVGVPMASLEGLFPARGPLTARLSGGRPRGYRFEPCGHEIPA